MNDPNKMTNFAQSNISISDMVLTRNGSYIDNDLMLVNHLGDIQLPREPHRLDFILLALCTKGQGEYSVDTIRHTVKAGDIIIISNGSVLDDFNFAPEHEELLMMISDEYFHEILSGMHELSAMYIFSRLHPVFHLNKEKQQDVITYFNFIKTKVDDVQHHFRRETVLSLIKALIYDAGNTIWQSQRGLLAKRPRAEELFVHFIQMVEKHFHTERRVGCYALQLNITPKYLSEIIRQVSHQTPNEWIDNYVTLELRNLLKNTSKSIKQITEDLNFANQSFLGKYFKEHVGMSPSEYRKRYR